MAKEEAFQAQGKVMQALANTQFRVKLDSGHEIIAHIAGKMRKHFIRILPGDVVTSPEGWKYVCSEHGNWIQIPNVVTAPGTTNPGQAVLPATDATR